MNTYDYITEDIAKNYSDFFENKNLKLDDFVLFQDMSAEQIADMKRLKILKDKTFLTNDEKLEMSNLLLDLRNVMPNSIDFNKIQGGLYATQMFIRDNTVIFFNEKKQELQNMVNNFGYVGEYDSTKQYHIGNKIKADGMGFVCIKDCINQSPNAEHDTEYWVNFTITGDKGDMGITTECKGIYNEETIYNIGDSCSYEGVLYYALEDNMKGVSPIESSRWATTSSFIISSTAPMNKSKLWLDISESDGVLKRYIRGVGWVNLDGSNPVVETAKGTSNEILVTIGNYLDGTSKTFKAKYDNNKYATTINGKQLYTPNTVNPPSIKVGKYYTVIYDLEKDCFFIKASAEGTATSSKVLEDCTFSNDDDTGIDGGMKNNGNLSKGINCGQKVVLNEGYYSGGTITANSLASQTQANGNANTMLNGTKAWIDGTLVSGNIPNRGEYQYGKYGQGSNYIALNNIPYGYYPPSNNGWSPEIRCSFDDIRNAIGMTPNKIVAGNRFFGMDGIANTLNMARCVEATDSKVSTYTNASGKKEFKITTGFKPRFVMVNYFHSTYNGTTLSLMNYREGEYFGMGKRDNNSTTSTYGTSAVMARITIVDDGVLVLAEDLYNSNNVDYIVSE